MSRHVSIAASAAFCARRIPASCASVFERRRSSKSSWSTSSSMPAARSRSASQTGKFSGTLAWRDADARHLAHRELGADLLACHARPRRARRCRTPRKVDVEQPERAEPRRLHRVREDVLRAAGLGVEDRIGNAERDRVSHVRRAERVGVDEEVGHASDPSRTSLIAPQTRTGILVRVDERLPAAFPVGAACRIDARSPWRHVAEIPVGLDPEGIAIDSAGGAPSSRARAATSSPSSTSIRTRSSRRSRRAPSRSTSASTRRPAACSAPTRTPTRSRSSTRRRSRSRRPCRSAAIRPA